MAAPAAGQREDMVLLLRLPSLLFDLLRRLFRHDERFAAGWAVSDPPRPAYTAEPAPVAVTPTVPAPVPAAVTPTVPVPAPSAAGAPPPPTADEAIERRIAREATEAAAPDPAPPTPLRPIGDAGHVDQDAELVESFGPADDAGATITVDEPWDGYAALPAAAIVARLRAADPATKAVVALYERGHKNRATVLRAAN
jgi:hypothetical protein